MMKSKWMRYLLCGISAGIAWLIGIMVFFGPAQILLADPGLQSEKMLNAFTSDPLPRTAESPGILLLALVVIGIMWSAVFVWLSENWQGSWKSKGMKFSAVAWVLMVPWFQFYLPWNVLHEPWFLVLLEMLCWAGVLFLTGMAIAGVDSLLTRMNPENTT